MEISANMRRARPAAGSSSQWRKSGKRLFARLLILSYRFSFSPYISHTTCPSLLVLLLLSYPFSFSPSTTPATPPSFLVLLLLSYHYSFSPSISPSLPTFLLLTYNYSFFPTLLNFSYNFSFFLLSLLPSSSSSSSPNNTPSLLALFTHLFGFLGLFYFLWLFDSSISLSLLSPWFSYPLFFQHPFSVPLSILHHKYNLCFSFKLLLYLFQTTIPREILPPRIEEDKGVIQQGGHWSVAWEESNKQVIRNFFSRSPRLFSGIRPCVCGHTRMPQWQKHSHIWKPSTWEECRWEFWHSSPVM